VSPQLPVRLRPQAESTLFFLAMPMCPPALHLTPATGLRQPAPRPLGRSLKDFWLCTPSQLSVASSLLLVSLSFFDSIKVVTDGCRAGSGGELNRCCPSACPQFTCSEGGGRRGVCAQSCPLGNAIVLRLSSKPRLCWLWKISPPLRQFPQ
jgi:hypothetical protein